MEDAVDALKMAFSVFVFILALAIVFAMFSQAREVSDIVISKTDNTYFTQYSLADEENTNGRIVGIETIIPTLYRYYKEKFSIDVITNKEEYRKEYNEKLDEETERLVYSRAKDINGREIYKDYIYLYPDGISWLARPNVDIQNRVNAYIAGKADTVNGIKLAKYGESGKNLEDYKNKNFIETFVQKNNGERKYEGEDGSTIYLIQGTTKLYITYELQK